MDGIQPVGGGGNRLDIGKVVTNLVQNDMYFETILYAITEILKEKKDKDGNPIMTVEEMEAKVKECLDKIRAQSKLAVPDKPSIIIPK